MEAILKDLDLVHLTQIFEENGVGPQEVLNLSDSEFLLMGIKHIGDRARLRQRCRSHLNGATDSPAYKKFVELNSKRKKNSNTGTTTKKKSSLRIYCGWKHSNGSGYKHVPLSQGGGSLVQEVSKDASLTALTNLLISLFFPQGYALQKKIKLDNCEYFIGNFNGVKLPSRLLNGDVFTIDGYCRQIQTSPVRLYLFSQISTLPIIRGPRRREPSSSSTMSSTSDLPTTLPSSSSTMPSTNNLPTTLPSSSSTMSSTSDLPTTLPSSSSTMPSTNNLPTTLPSSSSTMPSTNNLPTTLPSSSSTMPSTNNLPTTIPSSSSTMPSTNNLPTTLPSSSPTMPSTNNLPTTLPSSSSTITYTSELQIQSDTDSDSLPDLDTGTPTITFKKRKHFDTLEDILFVLKSKVNNNLPKNIINVSRHDAMQGARRAFNRNSFNSSALLSVKFSGENGIDDGGLTRELLQILLNQIKDSPIFQGSHSKMICPDVQSDSRGDYFLFGKIIAYSFVHGGPAPKFFSNTLFSLISQKVCRPTIEDICDYELENSIKQISTADNLLSLQEAANPLLPHIEFIGALPLTFKFEEKDRLVEILIDYFVVKRNSGSLKKFCEGLEILDVLKYMKEYPELLRPLFVYSNVKLDASTVDALFIPEFSDNSQRRLDELESHSHWRDFLIDLEEKDQLEKILSFVTGLEAIPPLGFQPSLTLKFKHPENEFDMVPFANTCANSLTIPVLAEYNKFKDIMDACLDVGNIFTNE